MGTFGGGLAVGMSMVQPSGGGGAAPAALSYPALLDIGNNATGNILVENVTADRSACLSDISATGSFTSNVSEIGPLPPGDDATITVTATAFGPQTGQLEFYRSDVEGLQTIDLESDRIVALLLDQAIAKGATHGYDFAAGTPGADRIGGFPTLTLAGSASYSTNPADLPTSGAVGAIVNPHSASGGRSGAFGSGLWDRSVSRSFVAVFNATNPGGAFNRSVIGGAGFGTVGFVALALNASGQPYIYVVNSNTSAATTTLNVEGAGWGAVLVTYNAATTTAAVYVKLLSGSSATASNAAIATNTAAGAFAIGSPDSNLFSSAMKFVHFSTYNSVLTSSDLDDFVNLL